MCCVGEIADRKGLKFERETDWGVWTQCFRDVIIWTRAYARHV